VNKKSVFFFILLLCPQFLQASESPNQSEVCLVNSRTGKLILDPRDDIRRCITMSQNEPEKMGNTPIEQLCKAFQKNLEEKYPRKSAPKDNSRFFSNGKLALKESLMKLSDSLTDSLEKLREPLAEAQDAFYPPKVSIVHDTRQLPEILILHAFREKESIKEQTKRIVYICARKSTGKRTKVLHTTAPSKLWLWENIFERKKLPKKETLFDLLSPEQIDSFPKSKLRNQDETDETIKEKLAEESQAFWEQKEKEEQEKLKRTIQEKKKKILLKYGEKFVTEKTDNTSSDESDSDEWVIIEKE